MSFDDQSAISSSAHSMSSLHQPAVDDSPRPDELGSSTPAAFEQPESTESTAPAPTRIRGRGRPRGRPRGRGRGRGTSRSSLDPPHHVPADIRIAASNTETSLPDIDPTQGGTEASGSTTAGAGSTRDDTALPPFPAVPFSPLLSAADQPAQPKPGRKRGRPPKITATVSAPTEKGKGREMADTPDDGRNERATSQGEAEEEAKAAPRAKKARASTKRATRATKPGTIKPILPDFLAQAPQNLEEISNAQLEARQQQQTREMNRARDPALTRKLLQELQVQQDHLRAAYAALNDELVKVQIEESVLRNVRTVVRNERDRIRYGGRTDIAEDLGERTGGSGD